MLTHAVFIMSPLIELARRVVGGVILNAAAGVQMYLRRVLRHLRLRRRCTSSPPAPHEVIALASPDRFPCGKELGLAWKRAASQNLNADPYNLCAEHLAIQDCTIGVDVRRTWSEKEMVRSFGGHEYPGTPDGMFESWDGTLTCVQVVRVPLLSELSLEDMREILEQIVLTKVVKSQAWLQASHIMPHEFVIFCWLPLVIPEAVADHAEALMALVRQQDPRFSLRLRIPAHPNALFPALFASNHDMEKLRARSSRWSDVATYNGSDPESSEEEDDCIWDITWAWDENFDAALSCQSTDEEATDQLQDSDKASGDRDAISNLSTTSMRVCRAGDKCQKRTDMNANEDDSSVRKRHFPWDPGG